MRGRGCEIGVGRWQGDWVGRWQGESGGDFGEGEGLIDGEIEIASALFAGFDAIALEACEGGRGDFGYAAVADERNEAGDAKFDEFFDHRPLSIAFGHGDGHGDLAEEDVGEMVVVGPLAADVTWFGIEDRGIPAVTLAIESDESISAAHTEGFDGMGGFLFGEGELEGGRWQPVWMEVWAVKSRDCQAKTFKTWCVLRAGSK